MVDVDDSYQISFTSLEHVLLNERENYDTCIVVPVSMYGHTFNKDALLRLQHEYNFNIVEDCSQAHGSKFEDGNFGWGQWGLALPFPCIPVKI